MNWARETGRQAQGFLAVRRLKDGVSTGLEKGAGQFADAEFVFDHQDRLGSPGNGLRSGGFGGRSRGLCRSRQINFEGRPGALFAFDPNEAAALLDNSVYGGESKTGTLTKFLGREKRLEDARFGFRDLPCFLKLAWPMDEP